MLREASAKDLHTEGIKCLRWHAHSLTLFFFFFVKNESVDASITQPHSETNLHCKHQGERVLKHSCTNNKYPKYLHARRTRPVLTMPGLPTSKWEVLEKTEHEDGGVCGPSWWGMASCLLSIEREKKERNDCALKIPSSEKNICRTFLPVKTGAKAV